MSHSDGQSTLADYLAVFRRRKWLIVLTVVVTVAAAAAVSRSQTAEYTADAEVLINSNPVAPTGPGSSNPDVQARYDATQAQLAHTLQVAGPAVKSVSGIPITPDQLLKESSVTPDTSSNILTFTVTNRRPQSAISLVNAFARQFTLFREAQDTAAIDQQLRGVNRQIAALTAQISAAKAAGQPTDSLHVKVNRLTRTQAALTNLKLLQTGGASMASSATSATQTQPKIIRNALLAVALGLVLGLIIATLRETLDSRVRSADDIAEGLDIPLLARLPSPPRKLRRSGNLALLDGEFQGYAEGYRRLRVALDYVNLQVGAKTILVTSAVEQEGKSTTAANLAIAIARTGRTVILGDLDLRRPSLDKFFNLESRPGLTDAVAGAASAEDVLRAISLPGANFNGAPSYLHLLPSGSVPANPGDILDSPRLAGFLSELAQRCDYLILDSPPLLVVSDAVTLGGLADGIVVIIRSSTLRGPSLGEPERTLALCRATKLGYVLTAAEADDDYGAYYHQGTYYVPESELPGSTPRAPTGRE